jgi:hypothetical protein
MTKAMMEVQQDSNRSQNDTFAEVLRRRLSRRGFLKGAWREHPY